MARIRSIHPGLWTDSDFVGMSAHARLLLIGIWNEADDYGVIAWKPLDLKIRLAPGDNIDATKVMEEIVEAGFLVRISRSGKPYGVVKNFRKFQRPKNPSTPLVPIDDEISSISFGSATPAIPQPYPSPTENKPQMEDVGGREGEKGEEGGGGDVRAREADPPSEGWTDAEYSRLLVAAGVDPSKDVTGKWHGSAQRWEADRWRRDLGLTFGEAESAVRECRNGRVPGSLAYFTPAMQRAAGRNRAPPLSPDEPPPPAVSSRRKQTNAERLDDHLDALKARLAVQRLE